MRNTTETKKYDALDVLFWVISLMAGIVLVVFGLSACDSNATQPKPPEAVMREAIKQHDYARAAQFCGWGVGRSNVAQVFSWWDGHKIMITVRCVAPSIHVEGKSLDWAAAMKGTP